MRARPFRIRPAARPAVSAAILAATTLAAVGGTAPPARAVAQVSIVLPQGTLNNDAVAFGPDGRIYATYCLFGQPARHILRTTPEGVSETFVSFPTTSCTLGMAFDGAGNLYAANLTRDRIHRIFPDGTRESYYEDPVMDGPADLEFHPSGNGDLYVVTNGAESVLIVHPDRTMSPFHTGGGLPGAHSGTFDAAGNFYVANTDSTVVKFLPDGTLLPFADFQAAYIHCTGTRLFASSIGGHQLWELSLADGSASWIAGSGTAGFVAGPADVAQLHSPNGITSNAAGTTLYVSSGFGNGLFRIDLDEAVGAPARPGEAAGPTGLLRTRPNPFVSSTQLAFRLPEAGPVELAIYDVRGRLVRTLASGRRPAGVHEVAWDGRAAAGAPAAAGIYFARFRGGGVTRTERIVRHR